MIEAIREGEKESELNFTGNWFIDAGIIGFINLMEEVYGWKQNDITIRSLKEKERFYYAYFAYYIKKTAFDWIDRQSISKEEDGTKKQEFGEAKKRLFAKLEGLIKDVSQNKTRYQNREQIKDLIIKINESTKEEIKKELNNYAGVLKKSFGSKETILQKIDKIGIIINEPFLQNISFNNPGVNKKGKENDVLNSFEELVFSNKVKDKLTKNGVDKTISKYLFSEEEFNNIPYCKIPTLNDIDEITNLPSIFIFLSFPLAFNRVFDRNIFIYTDNLKSSYYINKSIKKRIEKVKDRSSDDIFKITWQSIIDYLTAQKSLFALENMYFIEYRTIQQQNLIDNEYIGIPKLQASILLDDRIRENLNKNVQFRPKNFKGNKYCWLIEEFIEGKSLYPIILDHVTLVLNGVLDERNHLQYRSSLYSLITDAKILELKTENKKRALFSADYFGDYRSLVREIKEEIRYTTFVSSVTSQISEDQDTRHKIARDLLNALKARDKNAFLNILLRNLNVAKLGENTNFNDWINDWIFDKVINNNISFERYELVLVMGLISGGKKK